MNLNPDVVGLTVISSAMEVHAAGCGDIARSLARGYTSSRQQADGGTTVRRATAREAIIALDEVLASWFGEDAYTQSSRDNGCWGWTNCKIAPCAKDLARGLRFDEITGQPYEA